MPTKQLQILEHPPGKIRVRPPDVHVSRDHETTTLVFSNHLDQPVTVILNPLVNPKPPALRIDPGSRDSSDVSPPQGGVYPYQVYIGPGTAGPKAKGLCDPIIIVYPPGHN
jgi:hypothetical protein